MTGHPEVMGKISTRCERLNLHFLDGWPNPSLRSMHRDHASSEACRVTFGMSSDRVTAIDTNRSTGNEVRSPRGQVHSCSGKFLRLTPSTGGGPRKNFVVQGHCTYRRRHVRFNPPRRDRIDLNVVRGELNGHGLGQLDDRSFRCAVRRDEPRSKERVHTANVNNLSSFITDP